MPPALSVCPCRPSLGYTALEAMRLESSRFNVRHCQMDPYRTHDANTEYDGGGEVAIFLHAWCSIRVEGVHAKAWKSYHLPTAMKHEDQ